MRVRARFPTPTACCSQACSGASTCRARCRIRGVLVPDEAIGADQDRRIVYVVDDAGMVSAKPVRTGPRLDGYRVIREGLTGDETIIINGLMRARPGAKVKVEMVTLPPKARDRRAASNEVRAFLRRPADLRVGRLDRPADRRRHRLYPAAGRAISRDRAADHRRARAVSGRRRRDGRGDGRDADRAGDQRRRGHALHVVLFVERRRDGADHHLQARHRSRPGAGAGAEPRVDRRAAPAGRSAPARHHHRQELARPDDGRAHAVAGQYLRPALRLQLCPLARARHTAQARRRRRPHHLRRARIFAAHLARSGKAVRPTG